MSLELEHRVEAQAAYFGQPRRELVGLLQGTGLRVLELGCASGALGVELKRQGKAAVVHGVERYPAVATVAGGRLDRVWTADLETLDPADLDAPYDALVAGDVLEHLRDPWSVLGRISQVLSPGAEIAVSVPNVRYLPVVADLILRGRFDYCCEGVLDRTHLRFFTRRSIVQLLRGAGFGDVEISTAKLSRRWMQTTAALLGDLGVRQFLAHARLPGGEGVGHEPEE